ncbi:MAG: PEGA domain-containing protein [Deltaproteobacteria bacterium]|nr:PEGA domain-containing protein [Deltaproteobacteria bacterium]
MTMERTVRELWHGLLAAVLVQAALAGQALAQKPKVLLIPYQPIARQAAPELAAQVTKALVNEFGAADSFIIEVYESGEVSVELADPGKQANMNVGKPELAKAIKDFKSGDALLKKYRFDQAIEFYQRGLSQLSDAAPAIEDVGPISQAYVNLGVAAFRRGKEDLADQALAQAAVLDPERTLDPREYPPLLLNRYEQLHKKSLSKARGSISVDVGVAGAEVFFDARSVGATPIVLKNVPPGVHFVRVVKEGAGVVGKRVEVESSKAAEFRANLGGGGDKEAGGISKSGFVAVAAAVVGNRVDVVVTEAVQKIGKERQADYVMFGGLRKGETSVPVATYLVNVATGALLRLIDIDIDLDMLSVSIEAFKLTEDLTNNIRAPGADLGPGPHTIVRGLAGVQAATVAEVDVGVSRPDDRGSRTSGDRRPVAEGSEGDSGNRRAVIDTGNASGARRSSMSDDGSGGGRPRATIGEIDEPDQWYENPWIWAGAGSGLVLVAAAATGGVVFYLVTRPPTSVVVNWTEE